VVDVPNHDEMIQRARDLAPFLRANIKAIDTARRLPPEVFDKLYEAGFLKMRRQDFMAVTSFV